MKQTKILLDTDIGDDIDDVLALALALKMEEVDLIGITTVFKDTNIRARMAKKVLKLCNRDDIPVYAGFGNSIAGNNDVREQICQFTPDVLDPEYAPVNNDESTDGQSAIDFIIDSAKKHGEELTIAAIGPLSNIARAIMQDPEAMSGVGRIVIMGGAFYEQQSEWNIVCDVEGAQILFNSSCPLHCVSLDVTQKLQLNHSEHQFILDIQEDNITGYLAELLRLWTDKNRMLPVLHDPLAIYYCIHNEILLMEGISSYVESEGKYSRGMTLNLDGFNKHFPHPIPEKQIMVSKAVNSKMFKRYFMKELFNYKI